ncbi:guanine deaminase [Sessilibacter corallicola]
MKAYRASILHFISEPTLDGGGVEFFDDGILLVEQGRVSALDSAEKLLPKIEQENIDLVDYSGQLIMPGFIDTHVHFPQINIIGSYGEKLLDWLNNYTFPAESKFSDQAYAQVVAEQFVQSLFSHGTTTAMVYCTVHPESVDAFFTTSSRYDACMLAGKVMMDRNCPENLQDTAVSSYEQSQALIDKWHKNGRSLYTVTPRFAPTSTPAQLAFAGKLLRENSGVYLQTHLSENVSEIEWVKSLYPDHENYLDVYDHYGLLSENSTFGHGIHLSDGELTRLSDTQSKIAFCPTSNLFLGSGLYDLARSEKFGVATSIATDVGAGTSLCQLQTLNEAYKVTQLQDYPLHSYQAFYWLTLANAKSLNIDDELGNFNTGKYADFIVLGSDSSSVFEYRYQLCQSLSEKLFLFMTMGDDRNIKHTYVHGECVY